MRRFWVALLLFSMGAFFLPLSTWLDGKRLELEKINRQHLRDIQEIKETQRINDFLEREVFPYVEKIKSTGAYDLQMLRYFDTYRAPFGLELERFIYFDGENAQMDYRFGVPRRDKKRLYRLLNHTFENGMIGFFAFDVGEGMVEGELRLYRLFAERDGNVSAH
ncbi:hypothetical protein [Hydrogenimonas cancrithermarum]|uniref:Uncharacterized protein n=1 Tax=Hydrogenimonas cancrithermarum TaxID=2993563 RepID=A0ABM8FMS4_9BACT|nr:hypothetical protein [Hydrogenimonas cancrithermarum]BDY12774.1 hypothetical protein HCR_10860 [Hydrogenimonas cancrithermarum]